MKTSTATVSAVLVLVAFAVSTVLSAVIPHPFSDAYPPSSNDTIRIEVVTDISGPYGYEGALTSVGALDFRDEVNKRGGICFAPGRCRNVSVYAYDVVQGGTLSQRIPLYYAAAASICSRPEHLKPHLLVSPFTTSAAIGAVKGAAGCSVPVAVLASSPPIFSVGLQHVFSSLPSPSDTIMPLVQLIATRTNIRTIALIAADGDGLATASADGFMAAAAKATGANFVGKRCSDVATDIDALSCTTNADCKANSTCSYARYTHFSVPMRNAFSVLDWVAYFASTGADAFIVSGQVGDVVSFMDGLEKMQWTPRLAATVMPLGLSETVRTSASSNWLMPSLINTDIVFGQNNTYLGTTTDFVERVTTLVPHYANPYILFAGSKDIGDYFLPGMVESALLMFQRAIERANGAWDPDAPAADRFPVLMNHVKKLGSCSTNASISCNTDFDCSNDTCRVFESFWGPHVSGSGGINIAKKAHVYQVQNSSLVRVGDGPAAGSFIFPADFAWKINWVPYVSPPYIQTIVLSVAIAVSTPILFYIGLIIAMRDHPVFKASSYHFLICSLIGDLFLVAAAVVMAHLPEPNDASICVARRWMFSMGFMISQVPIMLKTYRIYAIFQIDAQTIRQVTLKNSELATGVAGFVFIQATILFWNSFIPTVEPILIENLTLTTRTDHIAYIAAVCDSRMGSFFAPTTVLCGCVLFLMLWLSWKVHTVPLKFNETISLFVTSYVTCAMAVFGLLVQFMVDQLDAIMLMRSLFLLFVVLFSSNVMVLPKCYAIYTQFKGQQLPSGLEAKGNMATRLDDTATFASTEAETPFKIQLPLNLGAKGTMVTRNVSPKANVAPDTDSPPTVTIGALVSTPQT